MIARIALWASGIVGGGIFGAMLGATVADDPTSLFHLTGVIAGICAFICARLWRIP